MPNFLSVQPQHNPHETACVFRGNMDTLKMSTEHLYTRDGGYEMRKLEAEAGCMHVLAPLMGHVIRLGV